MARKKRSLAEALGETETVTESVAKESVNFETVSVESKKPTRREDLVPITGFFEPEVRKQLSYLALDQDKTSQALIGEALNLVFAKYGKSPIADEQVKKRGPQSS